MLIQNYALNFVAQWPAGNIQITGQNWIQKSMNFWLVRVVVPNLPEKDLGPVPLIFNNFDYDSSPSFQPSF